MMCRGIILTIIELVSVDHKLQSCIFIVQQLHLFTIVSGCLLYMLVLGYGNVW